MADTTINSTLLATTIAPSTKIYIANEFWGNQCSPYYKTIDTNNLGCFWAYYYKKCSHALYNGGRHVAARTHQDIVDIVRQLRGEVDKEDVRRSLLPKLTTEHANEEELLENSINLAASLLLMCDCGSLSHGFSGRTELDWKQGSLKDYLVQFFAEEPVLSHGKVKLEKQFIARNITRIAGVEIVWTDNLLDHLRLTDDDMKVHIFHHASFLERQRQR